LLTVSDLGPGWEHVEYEPSGNATEACDGVPLAEADAATSTLHTAYQNDTDSIYQDLYEFPSVDTAAAYVSEWDEMTSECSPNFTRATQGMTGTVERRGGTYGDQSSSAAWTFITDEGLELAPSIEYIVRVGPRAFHVMHGEDLPAGDASELLNTLAARL